MYELVNKFSIKIVWEGQHLAERFTRAKIICPFLQTRKKKKKVKEPSNGIRGKMHPKEQMLNFCGHLVAACIS